MSVRATTLSVLLGLTLLVAPPLWWQATLPAADVGDPDRVAAVAPEASAGATSPDDDVRDAIPAPSAPGAEPARPTQLRIDAIDVDAPLDPVGLEDDGAMELPDDVSRVGWYELGVAPGEAGSAVLAGHVDSRSQGEGALFELRKVEPGEIVTLSGEDGTEQRWEVTARTTHDRHSLPIDELFRWEGPPQLKIITCGGAFDAETGSYEENVVIHAIPA